MKNWLIVVDGDDERDIGRVEGYMEIIGIKVLSGTWFGNVHDGDVGYMFWCQAYTSEIQKLKEYENRIEKIHIFSSF